MPAPPPAADRRVSEEVREDPLPSSEDKGISVSNSTQVGKETIPKIDRRGTSNGPPAGDLSKGKRKEDGPKPHPSSQTPEQTGGGSKGPSSTNKLYKSVKSKVNTRITPPNK